MPSFVATLAGLLAVLGLQLYILGPTGSINLPYASPLVNFGQILIMPDWLSYTLARSARHRHVLPGCRTHAPAPRGGLSAAADGGLVAASAWR